MNKILTIQIVGYNSAADLPAALTSLQKISPLEVEIIYLDNGSGDDSLALVKNSLPRARIVSLDENIGFTGAHNMGLSFCTTPLIMLINPDVSINWPGVKELTNKFADKSVGAVQGKLYRQGQDEAGKRVLDSTGITLTLTLNGRERGAGQIDRGQYEKSVHLTAVTAAAGIYRLKALRDIAQPAGDIFDENFFAYKEDVDLGWRLVRAGWKVVYYPIEQGTHRRHLKKQGIMNWGCQPAQIYQRLRDRRTKYSLRNWSWMIIKNISVRQVLLGPIISLRLAIFFIFSLLYWPLFPVWLDILRGVPKMLKIRYEMQHHNR